MTDKYAVVGHPVAHSQSPAIHTQVATETGQDMRYSKRWAPLDGLAKIVQECFSMPDGVGLNVTMPFKLEALALADQVSEDARLAGAANTLFSQNDGLVFADNTDGRGLLRDLQHNLGVELQQRRILILGAGGAVQGVLRPLLQAQPAQLFIANRTVARAKALVSLVEKEEAASASTTMAAGGWNDIPAEQPWDVIINATPAGLSADSVPPVSDALVSSQSVGYDMVYGDGLTPFQQW